MLLLRSVSFTLFIQTYETCVLQNKQRNKQSRKKALRQISRVTVPILVDTNPYSLEKRKYGEVSGSRHAVYTSSIRTRILPESNFFRGMERSVSRPVNVLIFLDLPRIMECRWSGAPNDNFRKISVRKRIWDLEFSKHLLQNFLLAYLSREATSGNASALRRLTSARIFEHLKTNIIVHF